MSGQAGVSCRLLVRGLLVKWSRYHLRAGYGLLAGWSRDHPAPRLFAWVCSRGSGEPSAPAVQSLYALRCARARPRSALVLEYLLEHAHPVAIQNLGDLLVGEAALDQRAGQVAGVAMVRKVGQEVRL